jgi:methionine-gamma-lyase
MKTKMSLDSLCVKEGKCLANTPSHQLPLYATSSFAFETLDDSIDVFSGQKSGHTYSRYGNPTIDTVAAKIAALEAYSTGLDAYGYLTSSGMSAISVLILSMLKSGDAILTQGDLYGGTTELFVKVLASTGIKTITTDMSDLDQVEHLCATNRSIRMMFIETPANPTMKCIDIHKISKIAAKYGIYTCVDNTFSTPLIQQPLSFGVDFVIHSTTKYLNGHGNSIAGVIIGHDTKHKSQIWAHLKLLGATCNAWDAWLVNNGLKTLALRMAKHSENAMTLAKWLQGQAKVKRVNYPGLLDHPSYPIAHKQMKSYGGMLSFEYDDDLSKVIAFINRLKFCTIAPTLGDVDTLVLHPATSSHLNVDRSLREANGITDGLVRLSVGIEDVDDIIADLEQALV